MKGKCSVRKCENEVSSNAHLFPKNESLRNKWLKAMKCNNWRPAKWSKICCEHFKLTDYLQYDSSGTGAVKSILKPDAIFRWQSLKKHEWRKYKRLIIRKSLKDRIAERILKDMIIRTLQDIRANESQQPIMETNTLSEENLDFFSESENEKFQPQNETDLVYNVVEVEVNSSECELNFQSFHEPNSKQSDSVIRDSVVDDQLPFSCSVTKFKAHSKALHFYTGLENYAKFMFVFQTLGEACYSLEYIYKTKQKISVLDQFFLALMILKQNKTYYEVSLFFNIPIKKVGNIFVTWIRFMKLQWSEVSQWPSKDLVHSFTPNDFRDKFLGTRGIIDGTEIGIQKPGIPTAQQSTFSTYKNKSTVKVLVFASPRGLVSYISPAYGGSTSDRQIIERCKLIQLCDPQDSLMADKGFDVQDLLAPYGIKLNIPTFFKKKNQISGQTIIQDKKISSKRVHIERIIGLGKTYKILEGPLIASHTKLADNIIFVCFMLCNFLRSIISRDA